MSTNRSATLPQRTKVQALNARVQDSTTIPYMLNNVRYEVGDTPQKLRERNSNKFPIRPLPKDPYDTDWNMKHELVNQYDGAGQPLITPARPMPFTDHDLDYMKRKRADEEFASYQTWLSNRFDLNDPAEVQLFKKIAPSYFAQREALINEQIDLTAKYAKLKLFGPESEEDLQVEYMIETGRTQLPMGPIWEPWTWMTNQAGVTNALRDGANADSGKAIMEKMVAYNKETYQAGLFSPLKALNLQSPGPWGLNPLNRQDITGDPASRAIGPFGADVPINSNWVANYGGAQLSGYRVVTPAGLNEVSKLDNASNKNRYGSYYTAGGNDTRTYVSNREKLEQQNRSSYTNRRG